MPGSGHPKGRFPQLVSRNQESARSRRHVPVRGGSRFMRVTISGPGDERTEIDTPNSNRDRGTHPMLQHTEAPRRFLKATLSSVLITFLWTLPIASWAVMEGMSTEHLTRASDLVALGAVESAVAGWGADGTTIVTTATVVVAEVIRGQSASRKIEVEYAGGEVGDIGLKVSDEPGMKTGERVLLFLKRGTGPGETGKYRLVGKAQGKYSIGPDGVARKKGFSVVGDTTQIDAEIPLETLIEKIKRVQ